MKRTLLLVLIPLAFFGNTQTQTMHADASLRTFMAEWEKSVTQFQNGDATLWKQNLSHRDDVTMFGAFGGHERGWSEVGQRADWAATRFKEAAPLKVEYLDSGASGDLAYSVSIERSRLRLTGQVAPSPWAVRVTQVYRKENGTWKLLHRHSDPLVEKKAPVRESANDAAEVWAGEEAYWRYAKAHDTEHFIALWSEDFVGWPVVKDHPVRKAEIASDFKSGSSPVARVIGYELRRESVEIHGDIGVTFYRATMRQRNTDGSEFSVTRRLSHTWKKSGAVWQIVAGMSAAEG